MKFKNEKINFAKCIRCPHLEPYESSTTGTNGLKRHNVHHDKVQNIDNKQNLLSDYFYVERNLKPDPRELLKFISVVGLCAGNRPMRLLEDPGVLLIFKTLLHLANAYGPFDLLHALPHRTTVANNLEKVKQIGVDIIKSQLVGLVGFSLTLDHWKDPVRQRVYLSFSATYAQLIDGKYCVTTRFLKIFYCKGKTNNEVQIHFKSLLSEYNFKDTQLSITADNALATAFPIDMFNPCFAHNFALFFKHSFWYGDKQQSKKTPKKVITREDIENEIDGIEEGSLFAPKVEEMFRILHGDKRMSREEENQIKSVMQLIYVCKMIVSNFIL